MGRMAEGSVDRDGRLERFVRGACDEPKVFLGENHESETDRDQHIGEIAFVSGLRGRGVPATPGENLVRDAREVVRGAGVSRDVDAPACAMIANLESVVRLSLAVGNHLIPDVGDHGDERVIRLGNYGPFTARCGTFSEGPAVVTTRCGGRWSGGKLGLPHWKVPLPLSAYHATIRPFRLHWSATTMACRCPSA